MKKLISIIWVVVVGACGWASISHVARGNERQNAVASPTLESCQNAGKADKRKAWIRQPEAEASVTEHRYSAGGRSFEYTATAGTLVIRDDSGRPVANMGYIAYTRDDMQASPVQRPVMFAFNGGPGFSAVPLNVGLLGPKRVLIADPGSAVPPPYKMVDNEFSMLDKTDLVMIDPIGTGVSHAVCGGTDQEFWSVDADVDSVSRFIVQYLSAHNRWTSPKYIIGESYGTTRAAAVVEYLRANDGVTFNGVVFVSIATDMELIPMGPPRNELSYTFLLPSYAAVAWFHHKVADEPPALVPFLNEVRRYAAGPFTAALLKGDALPDEERDAVAEQVHKYTGLSVEYLEKVNLRVPVMAFAHEFLEGEHETVGRLDGRFVGPTLDPLQSAADYDPALGTINPVYSAAFQDYYHRELNFGIGQNYQVWNVVAGNNWNMVHKPIDGSGDTQTVVNSGVDLAQALVQEPNLRVLVLSGYFDLGSPFMAAEYMVSHLGVPKEAASRVQIKYYEAGHMMYVNPPSLEKIKRDLDGFVEATH